MGLYETSQYLLHFTNKGIKNIQQFSFTGLAIYFLYGYSHSNQGLRKSVTDTFPDYEVKYEKKRSAGQKMKQDAEKITLINESTNLL
jgi:hypothetical protein